MKQFFSHVWQGFLRCVWVLVKAIAMEGSAEQDPDMVDPYETTWRNGPFSYTSAYTENEHSVGLFGRLWIDRRGKRLFKVYHNIYLSPRLLFHRFLSAGRFYRLCAWKNIPEEIAKVWWHSGGMEPRDPYAAVASMQTWERAKAFLSILLVPAWPIPSVEERWHIFTTNNPNWQSGELGKTFDQVFPL